jgi:hypothetical protein
VTDSGMPLEFTKNLGGAMQSKVIGALGVPLPSSDPMSAYRYARARNQVLIDSARQKPLIRLQDKNLNQLATIGQEMRCITEEIAADSGSATVVIRGGDYLANFVRNAVRLDEDLHLSVDPIATQPTWKTRWGGKITNIGVKRDSRGIHTVELTAISNREHLKNILIASTPFFPPEVQPIKMFMLPGNCRTVCAATLFIQLARAFDPLASIPSNLFNPAGWINPLGPDAILNLLPTNWPIQVQFVNPLFDQSRTTLLTSAWQDFHTSTVDIMKDAGVMARAYTYFTEDEDNPHPELEAIVGDELANFARPGRNAVVVAFEDHSGYTGPTGTAIDGVINLFSSTLDDLITETVFPIDADDDGETDPIFRKLFGVAPDPPWAVYRDGQESGIIESGYFQHKGPVKTTMTGGKSPKLVNDLQCVSGDTVIEGPDGDKRIDVLAAAGKPFRVWSVTPEGSRVPATAVSAFKKGTAELFEYTLEDGKSIKATHEHRFLTSAGFVAGKHIAVGASIATVDHAYLAGPMSVPVRRVKDSDYVGMPQTAASVFRKVVSIESVGVDDFYDMTVPGLENYSANGFWNHNTFAIRWGLSQLQAVIVAGVFGSGGGPPLGAGLSDLYQGQLDNLLLAWQRYTNPIRALITGDLGYLERVERGSGTAYTISSILTLRTGDYKTKPFRGFKTQIRNGFPYFVNFDLLLDDRVGFEVDGILYVDQISAIRYEYDRNKPITYTVSVGDDTRHDDPIAQGFRAIQAGASLVGAIVGEGTLF